MYILGWFSDFRELQFVPLMFFHYIQVTAKDPVFLKMITRRSLKKNTSFFEKTDRCAEGISRIFKDSSGWQTDSVCTFLPCFSICDFDSWYRHPEMALFVKHKQQFCTILYESKKYWKETSIHTNTDNNGFFLLFGFTFHKLLHRD